MRMPSLAVMTVAATALLGTTAAFAGPFGGGGVIGTTETSYESLVQKPGDVLNGIFFVSSIQGSSGVSYTYGSGGSFLTGVFTGVLPDSHRAACAFASRSVTRLTPSRSASSRSDGSRSPAPTDRTTTRSSL